MLRWQAFNGALTASGGHATATSSTGSMRNTLHDELTPSTGSTALRRLWSAELVLGEAAAGEQAHCSTS